MIITKKKKKKKKKEENLPFIGFKKVDHRVKNQRKAKRDKYLDLARELRKLWNMRVTVIPSVVGVLGKGHKGLERGLEELKIRGQIETIQTTALLRSARTLRRVLET